MKLLIPLFSPTTGAWGGLTRAVAIAEAAKSMGHQVAFCASGYLEQTLQGRGYQVYPMPPTTMLGLPTPISRLLEKRSQRASIPVKPGKSIGNIWLVLWMSGYARGNYLRRLVKAEIEAAEAFQADRIFTELDSGAFLTAAVTGIPISSTYAQIMIHGSGSWAWRLMRRAMANVLQSYGLPARTPDELCFNESVLKIIPSIPELDDADPTRPDVRYVGHLIGPIQSAPDVDLQLEDGRRHAFVYVGTGSISLNTLQNALPQVCPSGSDWRCFVGAQSIATPYTIGAVEFHPYLPAETLLPRCDWTICHGGQNTIIQSLLHGVPLIIFPGPIFERRYNARKVEEAGAGVMGEVNQFTAEWLRAAFAKQQTCAPRAEVLGERLRSYGGPPAAVEAIMS
jgi:UDP:flavonoid glycosyltransferase YjiC (YdhE family)